MATTPKLSKEMQAIQDKINEKAAMVIGTIALINNGKGFDPKDNTPADGSKDRVIKAIATGTELTDTNMVRLTIVSGQKVYKNVRVSGQKLVESAIASGVKSLINSTINIQIAELDAGEKILAHKANSTELEIVQLENDRNQVVGNYFVTAGLNESVANAIASRKSAEAAF